MPNFTIRRRKKPTPAPEPEPAPEPMEVEGDEKTSDEESEDTLMDRVIPEAQTPEQRSEPPTRPEYRPERRVQFEEPENVAQTRTPIAPRRQLPTPLSRANDPYLRKPTMPIPPRSRHRAKSRSKFRYTTHYGMDGDMLDTRAKASLLYQHCFA